MLVVIHMSLLKGLGHHLCIWTGWGLQRLGEEEFFCLFVKHLFLFFGLKCQSSRVSKNWVTVKVVLDYHLVHLILDRFYQLFRFLEHLSGFIEFRLKIKV